MIKCYLQFGLNLLFCSGLVAAVVEDQVVG